MKRSPKNLQLPFQRKDKANRPVELVEKLEKLEELEELDDIRPIVAHMVR